MDWIASLLIIVTSLKKVIINFNELSLNCYPLCILIYVNIKKLNLLKIITFLRTTEKISVTF